MATQPVETASRMRFISALTEIFAAEDAGAIPPMYTTVSSTINIAGEDPVNLERFAERFGGEWETVEHRGDLHVRLQATVAGVPVELVCIVRGQPERWDD